MRRAMKIVVLAGGISTEREVSLVSGTGVCRALRKNGHRAILVDLFLGLEQVPADLDTLFDAPDGLCADVRVRAQRRTWRQCAAAARTRAPATSVLHVLEVCAGVGHRVPGLHGMDGEDGRIQPPWTCWACPIRLRPSGLRCCHGQGRGQAAHGRRRHPHRPSGACMEYGPEEAESLAAELPMPCVSRPSEAARPWACTYRRTGCSCAPR
jgi:D-alanine-D-alanine ligase